MSIIHHVEQGTSQWYALRIGRPTASQFHKILTPTGKPSSQARRYMMRLIAERMLNETQDDLIKTEWIERGRSEEPHAYQQFELVNDVELERVGFVTTDDERVGCSPDAVIHNRLEAVEIKCPSPTTQMEMLLDGPGNDYRPQVQGQLLVGEFEAVHLYVYNPRTPAKHLVTLPDPAYLRQLRSALDQFLDELDTWTERARALGAYIASERIERPLDRAYPAEGDEPLQVIIPDDGRSILDAG